MTTPPPASTPSGTPPVPRPPRPLTVFIGVVVAIVLVVAFMAFLLMRGWQNPKPDGTIAVMANQSWDGVELSVEGPTLPRPLAAQLAASNRYQPAFFVPLGTYQFRAMQDDQLLFEKQITLDREQPTQLVDLLEQSQTQPPTATATTLPASRP